MGMSEAAVEDRIRLAAPRLGGVLWRNNSGAFKDETGRWIRYGLANESSKVNRHVKSADLIGVVPVLIQPHHIGQILGLFVACEDKREGWKFHPNDPREAAQLKFLQIVAGCGGLGLFAQSEADFVDAVRARI